MKRKQTPTQTNWYGAGLVAAGALFFSTAIIFARMIHGIGSPSITFYRALSAFFFFSLLALWTPEMRNIAAYKDSVTTLLCLGLTVGATSSLYIYAVQHTTVAMAVLLNNTAPLYVAILAPLLLNENRPRFTWLSLVLTFTGIALITDLAQIRLAEGTTTGILAAFVSGLTLALTMLLSRKLGESVSGTTQVWWSLGGAALVAVPWALQTPWAAVSSNSSALLPLGIVAMGFPYMLYFLGLQQVKAQVASIVALLEPVSGILIGILFFKEMPNAIGVLGIILVLIGIGLISQD